MYRIALFIFVFVLVGCSNDDSTLPSEPTPKALEVDLMWEIETAPFLPQGLISDGSYAYVAAKGGGLLIFKDDGDSPTQIAQVPIADLGNLHAMNIFQVGTISTCL